MRIQPTTVMLAGFAGIVAYLMITSAKKTAQASGSVLASGGGTQGAGTTAYSPASVLASGGGTQGTGTQAATTSAAPATSSATQATPDMAGNQVSDFASWASQS